MPRIGALRRHVWGAQSGQVFRSRACTLSRGSAFLYFVNLQVEQESADHESLRVFNLVLRLLST